MLKLGIKTNPKQNALSGFNFLLRDSGSNIAYEIHIYVFPQNEKHVHRTCFLVIAYSILNQLVFQEYNMGVYNKRGSNANGRTLIFDVSNDYVKKVVPERNYLFLANVMF